MLLVPAGILGFVGVVLFFYFFTSVPLPDSVGAQPTVVLDSTGAEISTLQPQATREDVTLSELPEHVVNAVLAAEDAQFYEHRGISFAGVFRAAVVNVVGGEITQGGSTISQQYIKNVTTDSERSILRKIREAALAVKLERNYTKDEILEFYLNSIYFGRGAYGIQAASRAYFGKDALQLTPDEAALLAGVLPAPSSLDPIDNPEGADRRYRYVLGRLVEEGWLDPAEAGRFAANPPATIPQQAGRFRRAPYFLDLVQQELAERLGDEQVHRGLVVTTTLNLGVQSAAEAAYADAFNDIEPTGALVALDPPTGGIRALVGGGSYTSDQLNLALAERQPGSTFKPFALAAWVEQGKSPDSWFDAPAELTFDVTPGPWRVGNYGGAAFGQLSLREATWRSVNTVYAQVVIDVTPEATADLARRAGAGEDLQAVPSIVLGTQEVTPLELAESYNTFASGGIHHDAFTVLEVQRDGVVLYRAPQRGERAFSEQVAWTVTDVLRGVIASGTGSRADIGRPAAGKTGTTQNYGDAWFVGYTPQLTAVVWMGNRDNNETMAGEPTGGELPATTWAAFMSAALQDVPAQDFPSSPGTLEVVRTSPSPTETATELSCPEGQVPAPVAGATPAEDGTVEQVCVEPTPTGTGTAAPTATATEPIEGDPTASPSPSPPLATQSPSPSPSPSPAPPPPPPEPAPLPTATAPDD